MNVKMTVQTDQVKNFILSAIGKEQLDDDLDIFASGLVSSLFAIELMTYVEREYDIKVTMEDLDMNNFKSLQSIGQFIQRKQEGAAL